jgi:hypothetical protein
MHDTLVYLTETQLKPSSSHISPCPPYTTSTLNPLPPARYLPLSLATCRGLDPDMDPARAYDGALRLSRRQFETHEIYSFFDNNCHCFAMDALNRLRCDGSSAHSMAGLALRVFLRGRHVGLSGLLRTWAPWAVLMGVGLGFGRWQFAAAYGGLLLLFGLYFLLVVSPRATRRVAEQVTRPPGGG